MASQELSDARSHPHPNPLPEGEGTRVHPNRFPRAARLSGKLQFAAVYDTKTKTHAGPLLIFSRANGLSHHRLGLSVSRRVGIAVRRNRIKRLLREAFRLQENKRPAVGLDLVIVVRPHAALPLSDYQELLASSLSRLITLWQKRQAIHPC